MDIIPVLPWNSHILEKTFSFGKSRLFLSGIVKTLFVFFAAQGNNPVSIGHIHLQGDFGTEPKVTFQHQINTDDIIIDFLEIHIVAFIECADGDRFINRFANEEESCGCHIEKRIVVSPAFRWGRNQDFFTFQFFLYVDVIRIININLISKKIS